MTYDPYNQGTPPPPPPPLAYQDQDPWAPNYRPPPAAAGYHPQPAWVPSSPPASRSNSKVWLIVVGVVVLVTVGGTVAWLDYRKKNPPLPAKQTETTDEKHRASVAAFGKGEPVNIDAAEEAALRKLFAQVSKGFRARDAAVLTDCFDFDRMINEVLRDVTSKQVRDALENKQSKSMFVTGFAKGMLSNSNGQEWKSFDIRRLHSMPDAPEAVVYLRVRDDDGYVMKARWWVRKAEGRWRAFDFEDLSVGQRATGLMTMALGNVNNMTALTRVNTAITTAAGQLQSDDPAAAKATLEGAAGQSIPPTFEAVRLSLLAACHVGLGDNKAALAAADRAEKLQRDLPMLDLLRGRAHHDLGDHEAALAAVDRYEKAVGPEAASLLIRGQSLVAKDDRDGATKAFREALDDDPDSTDAFGSLAGLAGEASLPELKDRLAAMGDKQLALRAACNAAVDEESAPLLAGLLGLYRQNADPAADVAIAFFQGHLHILKQEYAQAVTVMEAEAGRLGQDPFTKDVYQGTLNLAKRLAGEAKPTPAPVPPARPAAVRPALVPPSRVAPAPVPTGRVVPAPATRPATRPVTPMPAK